MRRRLRAAALVAAGTAMLAACSTSGHSGPSGSSGSPSSGSGSGSASGAAAAGSGQYVNPVWDQDFPDPSALRVGATWHAYATQDAAQTHNIQTLTSPDLVHWKAGPDALPEIGSWATAGNTWAPEVIRIGARYVMYYVARSNDAGKQCIGRATATDPSGPFTDASGAPLVCQAAIGGSIDPDPIRAADGALYLYWKNDGNCCSKPVHLWGQRMNGDGSALVGRPVALMTNAKAWQGNLVEAPEMVAHGGAYVLFYSANDYASADYGIGYASCRTPLGPCVDRADKSLIASTDAAAGPGHCFVVTTATGRQYLLYHAWPGDAIGSQDPGRLLWLEPLTWTKSAHGDVPSVHPSDASAQPMPR